jgi:hypothetical protein
MLQRLFLLRRQSEFADKLPAGWDRQAVLKLLRCGRLEVWGVRKAALDAEHDEALRRLDVRLFELEEPEP